VKIEIEPAKKIQLRKPWIIGCGKELEKCESDRVRDINTNISLQYDQPIVYSSRGGPFLHTTLVRMVHT